MVWVYIINSIVVGLVVTIHYEFLHQFTRVMPRLRIRHRLRIVVGVLAALIAHAVEVWIFAISFYLMHHAERFGHLQGNFEGTLAVSGQYVPASWVGYEVLDGCAVNGQVWVFVAAVTDVEYSIMVRDVETGLEEDAA